MYTHVFAGFITRTSSYLRMHNVDNTQNIISFCTGYGGLEIGIKRAGVDVRTVCNVEIEAFCSKPTWLRRLKKGGWITHLSGRILKPSLHESFVEKYTASLEDIHANHSVQQASDKEKKTQDTYGHTSSSTSGQLDLFGVFGKMSQDIPRWGYGESCPIWKKKVIDARGYIQCGRSWRSTPKETSVHLGQLHKQATTSRERELRRRAIRSAWGET